MKILNLLFALFFTSPFFAQINTTVAKQIVPQKHISLTLPTTNRPDWIAFYERNGFTGSVAKYAQEVNNFVMPFANPQYISMKVAPDYLAYITFDDEFNSTLIFWGENPNFYQKLGTKKILSIKIVQAGYANIGFGGISTTIENNDCKRFFGSIKMRMVEKTADNQYIYCPIKISDRTLQNPENPTNTVATIFNVPTLNSQNTLQNYVFSNNPVPEITTAIQKTATQKIGDVFLVNSYALTENRIFVEFEIDLASAHKSGDFSSDFSSNVKMARKEIIRLPYTELATFFSIGPFRAIGSPDNTTLASGGIFKDFRVHFIKQNPNP